MSGSGDRLVSEPTRRISRRGFLKNAAVFAGVLIPPAFVGFFGNTMEVPKPRQPMDPLIPFDTGYGPDGKKNPPFVTKNNVVTFEALIPVEDIHSIKGTIEVLEYPEDNRIWTQIVGPEGMVPEIKAKSDGSFEVDFVPKP